MIDVFNQDDTVKYCGTKHSDLKTKIGIVLARVSGYDGSVYVVSFGKDAYVMSAESLSRHTFKEKDELPSFEIERIERKYSVDV